METAFKNGWNAAIAAVQFSEGVSMSADQSNTGSQTKYITVTATGGNGKNSLQKNITVKMTNSHTEATVKTTCGEIKYDGK